MTVESNHAIATATFGDWLKNLAPAFQLMISKQIPIAPCTHDCSRALSNSLQVTAKSSDWFIALFAPVVIGRSSRPYSYSQYWTGTSLQWRLMRGYILKIICI